MQTNADGGILKLDQTDSTALVLLVVAGLIIPALVFFIVRQLRQPGVSARSAGYRGAESSEEERASEEDPLPPEPAGERH